MTHSRVWPCYVSFVGGGPGNLGPEFSTVSQVSLKAHSGWCCPGPGFTCGCLLPQSEVALFREVLPAFPRIPPHVRQLLCRLGFLSRNMLISLLPRNALHQLHPCRYVVPLWQHVRKQVLAARMQLGHRVIQHRLTPPDMPLGHCAIQHRSVHQLHPCLPPYVGLTHAPERGNAKHQSTGRKPT